MSLAERVRAAVYSAPVVDIHTHLFPPEFSSLMSSGIDDLLTYHYLTAEVLRAERSLSPSAFFAMSKAERADLIWSSLFVRRTPLSEATSGVVTVLSALGLDPRSRDLDRFRRYFAGRDPLAHLDEVFRLAGVSEVVMTNDPLDPSERGYWESGVLPDSRFLTALRIDPLVNHWASTRPLLLGLGYEDALGYLRDWIGRLRPVYLAVSLPDTFSYAGSCSDADGDVRVTLDEAVLPACREFGLPLAMMIGVRRRVNPMLRDAGDGMGVADLTAVANLASENPDVRFLVTTLAKENAHGLCVLARKFSNLLPFGCWWFMNNPSLVEQTTLMRLEMLGSSFIPQHSDARVLEQLIYKWEHARRAISRALTSRYGALEESGWVVSDEEIGRDVRALMTARIGGDGR